ncbi:hypothetical protein ACFYO2_26560 [Streptomyces sp. NPDC006602]|uniref:hypothetical protein n=1 Tax=Streptomyces sp. NPDC006602 TaxID=3364751 RepID=UPI0036ABDC91
MSVIEVVLTPAPDEDRQYGWPTWLIEIDGKESGIVYLDVPKGRFVVSVDTAFGYGKLIDEAVGEISRGAGVGEINAAIRRGYEAHLQVLKRLKVVDRESYPKMISTPMGGKPKA